jgi:ATP-dependent RNA helicase RhlE
MHFNTLNLITPLLKSLEAEGYTTPTPIQQQAIPPVLEGRDVLGIAQTGTGKTAAFALPILQQLYQPQAHNANRGARRPVRALVLAPTRELATQIGESFRAYGRQTGLRTAVVFGGVGAGPQIAALRNGVDILVACPGRLLDLIGQGHARLNGVQVLVLDEADRMLDMGFAPDLRRLMTHLPTQRQTLLFSATMPTEIQRLANDLLRDPVRVEIATVGTPAERVEHTMYFVRKSDKPQLLQRLLSAGEGGLKGTATRRVLVFARTKRGADRVAEKLTRAGIRSDAIHGNKSQGQRERALENFRRGTTSVMVATDLAARGLDVDGISHVINFDLPNEPETFVHRIGRTARAGASGYAISFCDADESEYLVDIEDLIQQSLPQEHGHAHHCSNAHASHADLKVRRANKGNNKILAAHRARPHVAESQEPGRRSNRPAENRGRRRGQERPRQGESAQPSRSSRGRNTASAPKTTHGSGEQRRTMHSARWAEQD